MVPINVTPLESVAVVVETIGTVEVNVVTLPAESVEVPTDMGKLVLSIEVGEFSAELVSPGGGEELLVESGICVTLALVLGPSVFEETGTSAEELDELISVDELGG